MRWIALFPLFALAAQAAQPEVEFEKDIKPILAKHCYECHNSEKHKGGLNLAAFETLDQVKSVPEVWALSLERIQAFEMPPPGKNELTGDKPSKLMRFMRSLPQPDREDCTKLASDRSANFYRGYVMSRRLNRAEINNTIRDLIGFQIDVGDLLPEDAGGGEGFDTSGNALFTSTIHIENYMAAADRILGVVLTNKPRALSSEAKAARAKLLLNEESPRKKLARDHARAVIERFQKLAFRRPISKDEVDRSLELFDRVYGRGDGFVPAIQLALKAALISPNFLFLAEPEPEEKGVKPLAAIPLASKLSYFLWSTMPDAELMSLAESGELLKTNVYTAQVKRLLADPRSDALGERFALQWLEIERLGSEVNPDAKKYPEFTPALRESMRREVAATFNYIIRNDRPLTELLDADYAFVDQRLASLYGISGVAGSEFKKVALTKKDRGGVTGMAAVHALTSYPLRTSPVLRGRWILEALLGDKVPPPPPDVPALEESAKDAHKLSMRDQLKVHRLKAECAGCHDKMDPLGFGLENFDNLGRWRETYSGEFPVDSQGTLPSGETFTGPAGLKKILMGRKDQVMKHLARKMTGYAFGRELNRFDECVVDRGLEALQKNEYRPSFLIEQIAISYPFRHRFYTTHD